MITEKIKKMYSTIKYEGDEGFWTVVETTERDILKTFSQQDATRMAGVMTYAWEKEQEGKYNR